MLSNEFKRFLFIIIVEPEKEGGANYYVIDYYHRFGSILYKVIKNFQDRIVYPKSVLYCYSKVANSYSCYHILFDINSIPQIKQQVLGWLIIVTRNLEYQEKIRRSLCTKLILYRIRLLLNKINLDQIKILISWKYPYWTIEYAKFTASLHIDSPDNSIRDLNLISRSKLSFTTKVIEIISITIVETKGRSSCNVINFGRYYVTVPSQKRGIDLDYNADLYHKKNKRDKRTREIRYIYPIFQNTKLSLHG
jgi:hypothetical protein